jgi:branched-chain amino acid transport system ATP-binding protein
MLLKVKDIDTYYGNFEALKGVSIEVRKGELVTLLGANGAGKTTLLMTIAGLRKSRAGTIEFNGQRLEHLPADARVRLGIALCPEGRKLFPQMPVYKNLHLGAYVRRRDKRGIEQTCEEIYQLFPLLRERAKQSAGTLSGGEQQMLAIGRALMSKPKLLLLDEPSLGLAPLIVDKIFDNILDIKQSGTTTLLVEQNANQSLRIADRGYIMETGGITIEGETNTLLNNEEVKRAYLGS